MERRKGSNSRLRRGEWYAASPPLQQQGAGGTRRRDAPPHLGLPLQHHENRPKVKNQKPLFGSVRLSTLFARLGLLPSQDL